MRMRAGILVIAALAAALALAGIGPAGATEKLNSFAGSCSVQGDVAFNPPVTNTEQSLAVDYSASGSCSGTLNGQGVSDAAVKLHHSGHSQGSCLGAQTTGPGQGTITFPDGTVIPYTFEFQATGTEVDFTLSGQRAGTGKGHGTFLNSRTPPDAALNCGGKGDATLPMDMSLTTDSPFVSGAGGAKGHLHLSGHPRRVKAGQQTRFVFRVTAAGQPAPGAVVRLAGRRHRTGPTGRAKLSQALPRAGRYVARVSEGGFAGDKLVVHAH